MGSWEIGEWRRLSAGGGKLAKAKRMRPGETGEAISLARAILKKMTAKTWKKDRERLVQMLRS